MTSLGNLLHYLVTANTWVERSDGVLSARGEAIHEKLLVLATNMARHAASCFLESNYLQNGSQSSVFVLRKTSLMYIGVSLCACDVPDMPPPPILGGQTT